jgi:hypothetical protein
MFECRPHLLVLEKYCRQVIVLITEVTIEEHEGDDGESLWSCQTAQGKVAVNMNSCTCSFYKSMPLPSRHVLKFREIKGEKACR